MDILKSLFNSRTRIKLLQQFLLYPEKEYYIRELTRLLNEQINSIRRELINLRKIGLLHSKTVNRKKFFSVNSLFVIYPDLKNIFLKTQDSKQQIIRNIVNMGEIFLLILGGIFTENEKSKVDIFIVGEVNKGELEHFIENISSNDNIRYSIIDRDNFLYRLEYNDKFIQEVLNDTKNIIAVNKLKRYTDKIRKI